MITTYKSNKADVKERRRTLKVYALLLCILCADSFLNELLPSTVIRILELLCMLNVLIICNKLHSLRRLRNIGLPILLTLMAILSIYIVIRGDWDLPTYKDYFLKIIGRNGVWLYISPFILLSLPNKKNFSSILRMFYYGSLLTIPIWIIYSSELVDKNLTYKVESIGQYLPFIAGFLLGFPSFFKTKENLAIRFIWAFYLFLMLLGARRNVSFSLALYGLIAYLFYFFDKKSRSAIHVFIAFFGGLIVGLFLLVNFNVLTTGIFKGMAQRANDDSRSAPHELFFADFYTSPTTDWIFGRGMDGTYFQPLKNELTNEMVDDRAVIETGYLQIMLKGGIIYDVLILSFLILAIRKAYKRKDSIINYKYISIFLMTYLIDMYTTSPVLPFQVRSVLFWFCVSIAIDNSTSSQEKLTNR